MEAWRAAALEHAQREYPREACGVVLEDGSYVACRNVAPDGEHFELPAEDFALADSISPVAAVFHSHPNGSCHPSMADRAACEASGLPWHIVGLPSGQWGGCIPGTFTTPLMGRPWAYGVLDCYSLVRDWYRRERGIELPNYCTTRRWWEQGEDRYVDLFPQAGFRRITAAEMRPGDLILMRVRANVTNHAAILLEAGVILHHVADRTSRIEVYGEYWRQATTHFLRHRACEP